MAAGKSNLAAKLFHASSHHIFAKPLLVVSSTWQILRHPSLFAETQISDEGEHRLAAAVKFFFSTFVVAFALHIFSAPFALYDGSSEFRELIKFLLQIAIGCTVVYFLLQLTCERLKVVGLIEIIIYVGATYLLIGSIFSIPITYVKSILFSAPIKVADIFGAELEKCLTQESLLYWAVKGELHYKLYSELWHPNTWVKLAVENWYYFLIIPFSLIFARMVRAKYGGNLFAIILIGCLGCFVAEASVGAAEAWIVTKYKNTTPTCHDTTLSEVSKKYSVTLIADQLVYKLGNELKKSLAAHSLFQSEIAPKTLFALKDQAFMLSITLKRRSDGDSGQFNSWADNHFKESYCSHNLYWEMLRSINYPLVVSISQLEDNSSVYMRRYEPQSCATAQ